MRAATVLHIPHSSTVIPPDTRPSLLLDDAELAAELVAMTDHLTETLFELAGAARVVYPVSRLVVDPERFLDDSQEPMSERGMGVIYERTSSGARLREPPSQAEREALLKRFYHPHHAALAESVAERLAASGSCLLIDCHSFPARARSFELDPGAPRPDINLGSDAFHTPPELVAAARTAFGAEGFSVEIDRPYRGTFVPSAYHQTERRLRSVMVEVNRALYLDEEVGRPGPGFERTKKRIASALEAFA